MGLGRLWIARVREYFYMTVYKKTHTSETSFSAFFWMPRFPLFHMVLGTEGKARITEGKPKG